jgi:vacuolar-type H+-ATPase subunit F/Vma7
VHDIIEMSRRGVPAIIVVSQPYLELARRTAAAMTDDPVDIIVVKHPLTNLSEEAVREKSAGASDAIVELIRSRKK